MKANKPSLVLYFSALFAIVVFDLFNLEFLVVYAKAIIVPSIFFYYLVSNNYKIGRTEALVFLFCFIGQVFDLMDIEISEKGSIFSFIIVYFILLKMILIDSKKIKIRKTDILPVLIVVTFVAYLLISILSLEFDKMNQFKFEYAVYGVILSILSCISFISYITRGTNLAFLSSVMACCFIASDLFYIFNQYFPSSWVLVLIHDVCQVLSYYLMARYFIKRDNKTLLHNN